MINQTKQILEESLKKIMLQKPLDKITIRDLTEDCGISRDQIESFLFHLTSDLLMNVVEEKAEGTSISEEDRRFIADFYKYSFVGLMLDWIKQGMKDDYVDLAHKISITIHGSLTHSIENFAALSEKENS
ncbi:MAG: hypothetical protein EGR70_03570 [[Ruminococcus] faecis]|nr:hypothetical protein [Mediterraneibacter faecis]